jgi:hypothetical protein
MAVRLINCAFAPGNVWTATKYSLRFTNDGNLEVWDIEAGKLLWQSETSKAINMGMQNDGNLVIYGADNAPLWSSDTGGNEGAALVLQDDGNLVIYSSANKPLWATNTNPGQTAPPGKLP